MGKFEIGWGRGYNKRYVIDVLGICLLAKTQDGRRLYSRLTRDRFSFLCGNSSVQKTPTESSRRDASYTEVSVFASLFE